MSLWKERQDKWDLRFMRLALEVASWSKDPSSKVGAVIVDSTNRHVLGLGYNGFPPQLPDEHLEDRDYKYDHTIHAELNAIFNAHAPFPGGSTIYVSFPVVCIRCLVHLSQAGIFRIVALGNWKDADQKRRWLAERDKTEAAAKQMGIVLEYLHHDLTRI